MKITLQGKPIPKKRPRKAKSGHIYNPQKPEMEAATMEAKLQYKGEPLAGALSCNITYHMYTPKCREGQHFHCVKPDIDNLEKFTFDVLNGVTWNDDAQIAEVYKRKIYSKNPRVDITIDKLTFLDKARMCWDIMRGGLGG